MWQSTYEEVNKIGQNVKKKPNLSSYINLENRYSNYFVLKLDNIFDLGRRDVIVSLVEAGCCHLSLKIFQYLDSQSLLAATLVCRDWQQLLLEWFYAKPRFRNKIQKRIFEHQG